MSVLKATTLATGPLSTNEQGAAIDPPLFSVFDSTVEPKLISTVERTLDTIGDPTPNPTVDPTPDSTVDSAIDPTPDPTVEPTADSNVNSTVETIFNSEQCQFLAEEVWWDTFVNRSSWPPTDNGS